jgi:hypothetical protein
MEPGITAEPGSDREEPRYASRTTRGSADPEGRGQYHRFRAETPDRNTVKTVK